MSTPTLHPLLYVYRTRSLLGPERWRWRLLSAGRIVATSGEGYTDRSHTVLMAAAVVQGLVQGGRVDVYRTRSWLPSQRWAWRYLAGNHLSVAVSGEGYRDRDHAELIGSSLAAGAYAGARLVVEGEGERVLPVVAAPLNPGPGTTSWG